MSYLGPRTEVVDYPRLEVVDNQRDLCVFCNCFETVWGRVRVSSIYWYAVPQDLRVQFYYKIMDAYHLYKQAFDENRPAKESLKLVPIVSNGHAKTLKELHNYCVNTIIIPFLQDVANINVSRFNHKITTSKKLVYKPEEALNIREGNELRELTQDLKAKYDRYGEDLFNSASVNKQEVNDTKFTDDTAAELFGNTDTKSQEDPFVDLMLDF